MKRTRGLIGVAGWAGLLLTVATAQAQPSKPEVQIKPPVPSKVESPPIVWTSLMVLVVAGAMIGATMMPAKRGHQD